MVQHGLVRLVMLLSQFRLNFLEIVVEFSSTFGTACEMFKWNVFETKITLNQPTNSETCRRREREGGGGRRGKVWRMGEEGREWG